jgi:hypothetical protein
MVILRIWHPSISNKFGAGSSALTIAGEWGSAHISTRPLKENPSHQSKSSTLQDDIEAEGNAKVRLWRFHRMDERRMLGLWSTVMGGMDFSYRTAASYRPAVSFRVSDLILAVGRGIDVDAYPAGSATGRARAMVIATAVANNFVELEARAEHFEQVEHW